jgi:hypothetical protein
MSKNFVSLSGISNMHQLNEIYQIYNCEDLKFQVAIGYQLSHPSINLGTQNTRQPKFSILKDLCEKTVQRGFIPAFHYYTKDNSTIEKDLEKIADTGIRPDDCLVQFNTLPPKVETLKAAKQMGFGIILKVAVSNKSVEGGYKVWKGEGVQDVSNGELSPLIRQVTERAKFIDYAMFDPSHGTKLELDLEEDSLAIRFGKAIVEEESLNHICLIYAGGISPKNVKNVAKSLGSFFPRRASIDTESGIRRNNKLALDLVTGYLINYSLALE